MRSQASSLRLLSRLPGSFAGCCAGRVFGSSEKATTIAPSEEVKVRRLSMGAFISSPAHLAGRAQDGFDDAVMRPAAAEVGFQRSAHVLLGRMRIAVQQFLRAHDHAVDAIAALRRLLLHKGAL